MGSNAYPMDSIVTYDGETPVYDRAFSSADLREVNKVLYTNGISPAISDCLKVKISGGMKVIVNPGFTLIEGAYKYFDTETTINLDASDAIYNRIDTIVARLDINSEIRNIVLDTVKGVSAAIPIAPALTRGGGIFELGLADVLVSAGVTSIIGAKIADTRLQSEKCGVISSLSEIDTTTYYTQLQSQITDNIALIQAAIDDTLYGQLNAGKQDKVIARDTFPLDSEGADDDEYFVY